MDKKEEEGEDMPAVAEAADENQLATRTKTLGSILGRVNQLMATIPTEQWANSEMTSSLYEEVIDGDVKPPEWCRTNGSHFPLLANMARR